MLLQLIWTPTYSMMALDQAPLWRCALTLWLSFLHVTLKWANFHSHPSQLMGCFFFFFFSMSLIAIMFFLLSGIWVRCNPSRPLDIVVSFVLSGFYCWFFLCCCYIHTDRDNWLIFLEQYKVKEGEMEQNNKKSTSSESLAVMFTYRAMMPAVSFEWHCQANFRKKNYLIINSKASDAGNFHTVLVI